MTNTCIHLNKGDILTRDDIQHEFVRVAKGLHLFERPDTGEVVSLSSREIIDLVFNGDARITFQTKQNAAALQDHMISLDRLPKSERNEALRRLEYVKFFEALRTEELLREAIWQTLDEVPRRIGDSIPPDARTLKRWYNDWCAKGRTTLALAPNYHSRGGRYHRVSGEVLMLAREAIGRFYLKREGESARGTYNELRSAISKANENRPPETKLHLPSLSSFYRLVYEIDAYTRVSTREGQRAADRQFDNVEAGPVAKYPLHIVQVDHTKVDVIIIDKDGDVLGRCWLTIALDLYSRMVVGLYLSMDAPKYASVMHCLKNSITPKHLLPEPFASVAEHWPCHGVMNTLVLDNGLEFHSTNLLESCSQLGIDITFCPSYTPHYKGAVERIFGTLNSKLLHSLPGTTYSDTKQKGDYDSEGKACLTFEELYELIVNFFACEYANAFHEGINKTPLQAWEQGAAKHPVRTISSKQDLAVLTAYKKQRHLTRKGIRIFGLFYNSSELESLRRTWKGPIHKEIPVQVNFDPGDIGHIYVALPDSNAYVRVECTTDYAKGLTLWQHQHIARKVRKNLKPGDTADENLLIKFRDHSFNLVQSAEKRIKRIKRRDKKLFQQDNRADQPQLPAPKYEDHFSEEKDQVAEWLSDLDDQDERLEGWTVYRSNNQDEEDDQ